MAVDFLGARNIHTYVFDAEVCSKITFAIDSIEDFLHVTFAAEVRVDRLAWTLKLTKSCMCTTRNRSTGTPHGNSPTDPPRN